MVDAYGYPVYLRLSEGQRNDINMAIPLLEPISLNGSQVLADRGYDSNQLIDYIYATVGNLPSPPEKEPGLSVTVTGGFIRKDI